MESIKNNLLELLKSKKFKVALFSVLGVVCTYFAGQITAEQMFSAIWPIVIAYLGAQGLSDAFGKGKIEAEAKPGAAPLPELSDDK